MKEKFDTDKLHLAVIKNNTENGVEFTADFEYALLLEPREGIYINLLNPVRFYPVFKRLPYSNTTLDGEDYGTKLALVSKFTDENERYCYVLKKASFDQIFGKIATMEEIENFVLNSGFYFADRKRIAMDRILELNRPVVMLKKYFADKKIEKNKVLEKSR